MDKPLTITGTPSRGLVIRHGETVKAWTDPEDIWTVMQWGVAGANVGGFYLTKRQRIILAREASGLLLEG